MISEEQLRHVKVLWVSIHMLSEILIGSRVKVGCVTVPEIEGLPDGWVLGGLFADTAMQRIGFHIIHPSFEAVPNGAEIPGITATVKWTTIKVDTQPENTITFREFL